MSEDFSQRTPMATWNPARSVWETTQTAFCGHSEPFLETWPKWGSMRTGAVFAQPTPVPLMAGYGFSSLHGPRVQMLATPDTKPEIPCTQANAKRTGDIPAGLGNQVLALMPTPKASDGPHGGPGMRNGRGQVDALPGVVGQLLPTPVVNDMGEGKSVQWWDTWTDQTPHGDSLAVEAMRLMPTPTVSDTRDGTIPRKVAMEAMERGSRSGINLNNVFEHDQLNEFLMLPTPTAQASKHGETPDITSQGTNLWDIPQLLPTPTTQDGENIHGPSQLRRKSVPLSATFSPDGVNAVDAVDFGPYTPAIRRWELVIGRAAPSPTEMGTGGKPRLSPAFVEWMMGLPEGWVTASGISRNAQLKALGNGVCPQQALLALSYLVLGSHR